MKSDSEILTLFSVLRTHEIQRDLANVYYTYPKSAFDKVIIKTEEELTILLSKANRLFEILEGMSRFEENSTHSKTK